MAFPESQDLHWYQCKQASGLQACLPSSSQISHFAALPTACPRSHQRSCLATFDPGTFMLFSTPNVALLLSHPAFGLFSTPCCCTATDRVNQTLTERTRRLQYNEADAGWLHDHQHGVIHQDLPDLAGAASVGKVGKRH